MCVFIAADTRITYRQNDGSEVHVDNAQKVLPFAPGTAIGYVGEVETASRLLQHMIAGRDRRNRIDPVSLRHWIPRFLRAEYRRLPPPFRKDVAFMVGSSFVDRPFVVEKAKIGRIIFEAVKGGMTGFTGSLLTDILFTNAPYIPLADTCAGFVYTMRSPDFVPVLCPSLESVAIGSGSGVVESIQRTEALILIDNPGHFELHAHWFRLAISGFVERQNISSVGGLYPVIRVRGNDFQEIGQSTQQYKRGSSEIEGDVRLLVENGRWVQKNRTNGKEIPLELPWNLLKRANKSDLFDFLDRRRKDR